MSDHFIYVLDGKTIVELKVGIRKEGRLCGSLYFAGCDIKTMYVHV